MYDQASMKMGIWLLCFVLKKPGEVFADRRGSEVNTTDTGWTNAVQNVTSSS